MTDQEIVKAFIHAFDDLPDAMKEGVYFTPELSQWLFVHAGGLDKDQASNEVRGLRKLTTIGFSK